MKKKSKLIVFTFLSIAIATTSCQKKDTKNESGMPAFKEMTYDEREATRPEPTQTQLAYMNSLPMYDKAAFDKAIDKIENNNTKKSLPIVMAIGGQQRIFKWNGSSWDEPNPAAHLWQVEASKNSGSGSVWGTSTNFHIFRWNGASWDEPNPNASLRLVVPMSNSVAYGIGTNLRIYVTINGGVSWSLFSALTSVTWMSVGGSSSQIYAISGATVSNLFKYSPTSGTFTTLNLGFRSDRVSTSSNGGAVYTTRIDPKSGGGYNYTMYKNINNSGYVVTPFPNEVEISSSGDNSNLWTIGTGNNIYTSPVNGDWWIEPNTAARAIMITAGYY